MKATDLVENLVTAGVLRPFPSTAVYFAGTKYLLLKRWTAVRLLQSYC